MKMKGMLFKEMSDKGVKRYSISLMSREIQGEMNIFFLPIRLEWWCRYKEGAYLDTLVGILICTVGLEEDLEVKCRYIIVLICIIELLGTGA